MLPIAVFVIVLSLDFMTKWWVNAHIPLMASYSHYPYGGLSVFQDFVGVDFSISHLTNLGAAWGTLTDYHDILVSLRLFLILGLILYAFFFNTQKSYRVPLSLIIAGAIGNVIDHYLYGHVVDMFYFVFWGYSFPVFNVADSAVSLGVAWLILLTAIKVDHKRECA